MPDVPDGVSPDARETWPHPDLIRSWLGDAEVDFEIRPGDAVPVQDDPEAQAAARRFRDVLGCFASGITVITSTSGGEPVGMTCQSFSSVSLDPPLVTFIPARSSRAWSQIQRSGRFCVNVLAADQEHVSAQMASKGVDKFAGIDWTPAEVTGAPVITGTLAHLDCTIHAVYEGGDHYIVVGKVEHLAAHPDDAPVTEPLLYYRGRYRTTDS
ncbi:flavin reductase family protein [Nocardioides sp. zg-ZUI104]|uniref:flavin reductase family protein n=1 Tax=Nocardioides faecalis TaxID=2803858 RepID=UPI001BCA6E45|nr:flavin reductase family protein [Nocardioides faecalis]MBS4754035.1 flavin reductase family protein [Nocardioides faecalis]